MSETKKKRGRKPKKNIKNIKEINNINSNSFDNKTIIIKLKKNKNKDEFKNELLPGYIKEDSNIDHYDKLKCWNCTSELNNSIKSIPLKYNNNIFYTYGSFCCSSCSLRYIIDNFKNKDLWNKYELFNLYNYNIYGKYIDVKIPPNKLTLKCFGGHLDIDEYKDSNTYNEINNPIIIPIQNTSSNIINKNNINTDLKLYRKPNKNILNNFNIN